MGGCCDEFYRRLRRPGDTDNDEKLRRLILPVSAFFVVLTGVAVFMRLSGTGLWGPFVVGCLTVCVIFVFVITYILLRVQGSYATMMTILALPLLLCILAVDLAHLSALEVRLWPTVVILMDYLIIIESQRWVQLTVVGLTLAWLAVMCVESVAMFGAIEFAGRSEEVSVCECSNPPCPSRVSTSALTWFVSSSVFVADFYVTRSFATGLRYQLDLNNATVTVAGKVAQLLADYSIDDARAAVAADGAKLSGELLAAFGKLLDNLERYRAFLPPALLADTEAVLDDDDVDQGNTCSVKPTSQVVPQLAVPQMRRAVQNAWSQAVRHCRDRTEEILTGVLEACITAGDISGARRLLNCGWAAPAALSSKLSLVDPRMSDVAIKLRKASPARLSASVMSRSRNFSIKTGSDSNTVSQGAAGRFGDGADDPAAVLFAAPLWSAEYAPPAPVDAVRGIAAWHDPTGDRHWPWNAVQWLIEDHQALYKRADPGQRMLALYVYTTEFVEPVVWALWQGVAWVRRVGLDDSVDPETRQLQLGAEPYRCLGLRPESSSVARLLLESAHGVRAYGVDGEALVLRYENTRRGDPAVSPLRDTVLWTPHPENTQVPDNMFSLTSVRGAPVPPGILEFITSRSFEQTHAEQNWESIPVDIFRNLHEHCMAQKNQQRPKVRLCRMAEKAFNTPAAKLNGLRVAADQLAALLPELYRAKCPSSTPTPAQLAHACEMGVLRWEHRYAVVALTGEPRIAVPLSDPVPRPMRLWRLSQGSPAQPYLLMNSAMRSQQLGARDARLTISGRPLPFFASQPEEAPPEPKAAVFRSVAASAQWQGTHWAILLAECPAFGDLHDELLQQAVAEVHGEVLPQGWGLPQYRALIWLIDASLAALDGGGTLVKGYRGLLGVTLSRSVYARGEVVMFPAFTSVSGDQGVAAGFAKGEGAAVIFTTFTSSGRHISAWSRYGREKEVLLRPNTLHLITDALSAEHAAIVDKDALQVFDLKEMTPAEATSHLAKEAALAVSRDHPSVLKQAERAAAFAERGDWEAVLRDLLRTPTDAVAGGGEGRFVRSVLPRTHVGIAVLVISSPDGPEIGTAVDPVLWNDFYELVEVTVQSFRARITPTHLGHIMVQVTEGGPEATAQAAVAVALEMMSAPGGHFDEPRKAAGSKPVLRVHCGVSVGTVHCGFGGSAQHRVEIADGPTVRRAFRMAAYSHRHGVAEVVTDAGCAAAAAALHATWTVDLVSFDSRRDLREPITCVEAQEAAGGVGGAAASSIQAAWDAVLAASEGDETTAQRVQECVAQLPESVTAHRAASALQDAAAQPSTYCYDLESGH